MLIFLYFQCFRILDREDKGYLTFSDIRLAADEVDCPLSNNQIQEMLDEADTSGNAEVELGEFVMMMLRTSAFKF
jgi:Ca2+-binding EF-hand superfamily protein